MRHGITSISGQVRSAMRAMTFVLMLPAVISLGLLLFFSARYQGIIRQMDRVANLKAPVASEIPEQLFAVAAGRISFADSSAEQLVNQVDAELNQLLRETSGRGDLQLTVALRTVHTLEQYVLQVRDGMATGQAITEMEAVVDEVRDVGALVSDMLDAFITVKIVDAAETGQRLEWLVILTAAACVGILTLSVLLSGHSTRRLTKDIHTAILHLEKSVEEIAGGNLQERVPPMEMEELHNLADQINRMADRLDALIRQIRLEQDNLAKAELRILQAQINPHFLYNTLDTIVWQAESGKSNEVIHLTRALSDFFRISLSAGAEWIPVEQEIRHVASYLDIQQTRYRDILRSEIILPEEAKHVIMLKFLLQPLVENALYHGIKAKRGGGTIRIQVAMQSEGWLLFTVRDQGKGMTAEELTRVRRMLQEEADSGRTAWEPGVSGFGLRNVDMRIRLYYRQPEGLRIESDQNGTVVTFCVPARTMEDISNDESVSGG